jgi:hypothetical protein
MVGLRRFFKAFQHIAIIFSFIFNFVFLIVLVFVLFLLFRINNGIVEPLVTGLHSSFVGLDEARIITTINVQDRIPVVLDIPLQQNTDVRLTAPVALAANAEFTLPGGGGSIRGTVNIVLPQGLVLPVALDLNVPVNSELDIALEVPVDISLQETQLHDPFQRLIKLFDPLARIFTNAPNDWDEVWALVQAGEAPNLLEDNSYIRDPWEGYVTGLDPNAPTFTPTVPGFGGDAGEVPPNAPGTTPIYALLTPGADTGAGTEGGSPAASATADVIIVPLTGTPGAPDSGGQPEQPQASPEGSPVPDLGIITPTPRR